MTSGRPVPMMAAHLHRSPQEPPVADPPPHVFVSYASADHARVAALAAALERAGVRVVARPRRHPGRGQLRAGDRRPPSARAARCWSAARPRPSPRATSARRWRSPGSTSARSCRCCWSGRRSPTTSPIGWRPPSGSRCSTGPRTTGCPRCCGALRRLGARGRSRHRPRLPRVRSLSVRFGCRPR